MEDNPFEDTTRTFGSSAARPSAGSGNTSAASFTAGQREANPFSSTSSYTPPQVAAPAPAPGAKSGAVIAGYATSPSAFDSHSTPTQPVLPVATQEPTAASTFPVDVVPQHKPAGAGNGSVPRARQFGCCTSVLMLLGATKIRVLVWLVLTFLLSLFIVIMSFAQLGSQTSTGDCSSAKCPESGTGTCFILETKSASCSDVCSTTLLDSYRPFKFRFNSMPDGESLYCTWRATNVKWRLLGNAGLLLVVGGAIFALIKDRRGLMAMAFTLMVAGGLVSGITMVIDAAAVRSGSAQCSDGFVDALASPVAAGTFTCQQSSYTLLVLLDAVLIVLEIIACAMLFFFRKVSMLRARGQL